MQYVFIGANNGNECEALPYFTEYSLEGMYLSVLEAVRISLVVWRSKSRRSMVRSKAYLQLEPSVKLS